LNPCLIGGWPERHHSWLLGERYGGLSRVFINKLSFYQLIKDDRKVIGDLPLAIFTDVIFFLP
jgi:hypothetical protein